MFANKFFKSFAFACKGFLHLLKHESNFKIQSLVACIAIVFGFLFEISKVEWMLQLLAIGLVLGVEALNTSIERLADETDADYNPKIGLVKDVAAAASLWVSFISLIIGLLIYIPKITLLF